MASRLATLACALLAASASGKKVHHSKKVKLPVLERSKPSEAVAPAEAGTGKNV